MTRVIFTSPVSKNFLLGCVLTVFFLSSKPQVGGINTRSVVSTGTVVEHAQTFWYGSVVQNPRRNMRSYHLAELWEVSASSGHMPVTFAFGTSPQPARVSLYNMSPEPIVKCLRKTVTRANRVRVSFDSGVSTFPTVGICSSFVLHSKLVLLCHALGCFNNARALCYLTNNH